MPTWSPARKALPGWLANGLTPGRFTVPIWPTIRIIVSVIWPLIWGYAHHNFAVMLPIALGGLWVGLTDRAEPYRVKWRRMGATLVGIMAGYSLGLAVHSFHDSVIWIIGLTLIAFAAGIVSGLGPIASQAGMLLMVAAGSASGLGFHGVAWHGPLLLGLGGLVPYALALVGWLWQPEKFDELIVAQLYRQLAALLAALGTPHALPARRQLTATLTTARHLVTVRSRHSEVLRVAVAQGTLLAGRATSLTWLNKPVNAELPEFLDRLADWLSNQDQPVPVPPAEQTTDPVLERFLATCVRTSDSLHALSQPRFTGLDYVAPAELLMRDRPQAVQHWSTAEAKLRFALILAVSTLVASSIAIAVPNAHRFWIPMTIAFILKPDLGPISVRAISRTLGTIAGAVVVAVLLVAFGNHAIALIIAAAVCISLYHAAFIFHYGFSTTVMTTVVMLIIDLAGTPTLGLLLLRIGETALASVIVILADLVLWNESWHARANNRTVEAIRRTQAYVMVVVDPQVSVPLRASLRRRAYQSLALARQALKSAAAEPPHGNQPPIPDPALIGKLERLCDAVVAASIARTELPDVTEVLAEIQELLLADGIPPILDAGNELLATAENL